MAATPERKVKDKIKAILESFGEEVYYAMPIGSGYGNSGVPDFLVCFRGQFIALEAKAGKGKTTALQEHHLGRIERALGISWVVNDVTVNHLREWLVSLQTVQQMRSAP